MTDIELLNLVKKGNEKAFRELFDRYYSSLSLYADRIVHDTDVAIDIVQAFFVAIYDQRTTLEVQNVRSFFYQAIHNRCLNHLKATKVRAEYQKKVLETQTEEYTDIEENIHFSELQNHLMGLIGKLPDKCRKIFIMSRLENISNDEIAEKLELSKRTVETQISNALKFIRENFKC